MPRGDNFYVIDFVNPEADGHVHYMVYQLDADSSLKKSLGHYKLGHPHIIVDQEKKYPFYSNKFEAEAEARRLGAIAQAASPDRVPADEQFPPGEVNRILEIGKPGAM